MVVFTQIKGLRPERSLGMLESLAWILVIWFVIWFVIEFVKNSFYLIKFLLFMGIRLLPLILLVGFLAKFLLD